MDSRIKWIFKKMIQKPLHLELYDPFLNDRPCTDCCWWLITFPRALQANQGHNHSTRKPLTGTVIVRAEFRSGYSTSLNKKEVKRSKRHFILLDFIFFKDFILLINTIFVSLCNSLCKETLVFLLILWKLEEFT